MKEKIGIFNKLEQEMLGMDLKRKGNLKKSFKEIFENVNFIHDNIDKYFNDIFKKGKKKEKKKKIINIDDDLLI